MKQERSEFILNYYSNKPQIFIDQNYNYLQKIKNLYPRIIADKTEREKIEEKYNQAVLYNITEYEKGIEELNLPFKEVNLSYLYDKENTGKLEKNKLEKNFYIYKELLTDIFKNLDKGLLSTLCYCH